MAPRFRTKSRPLTSVCAPNWTSRFATVAQECRRTSGPVRARSHSAAIRPQPGLGLDRETDKHADAGRKFLIFSGRGSGIGIAPIDSGRAR
jgi:hypothetical protein